MYCIKCGVELREGSRECPLCQTPVYFPGATEAPPTYPNNLPPVEKVSKKGLLFIITFAFAIAAVISFIADLNILPGIGWADYVVGALLLAYVLVILPCWFRNPNPVIFVPCDFALAAIYIWLIDFHLEGGWFFSFALPICAATALIVSSVIILVHYLRHGRLYIFSGAAIAAAAFSVLIEYLINVNFGGQKTLFWSLYPCAVLLLIGIMLLVIAIVKPFKESLKKLFSI